MYLILHDEIRKPWRKIISGLYMFTPPCHFYYHCLISRNLFCVTFITSQQNREGSALRHGLLSMCCFVRRKGDLVWRGKHSARGWVHHQLHHFNETKSAFLSVEILIQLSPPQGFRISLWNLCTFLWRLTCPWAWAVWPTALQSLSGSSGCRMARPSTP